LIASGSHIQAIAVKLAHQMKPKIAWIAGLGLDKVRYNAPARPDDILVLENEVIWKRKSRSDPNSGVIRYVGRLVNQRNEIVLSTTATGLVARRPAKGAVPTDPS
jgi:acyl dehydratase